jgi:PadR family transcriptional regulator, regulatory protein PadR
MEQPNTDVIQGTLDMLILQTVSLEQMHGFGIARRVEQISRGVFKVNPGSLLTALQRLERAGWLDSVWRQTENSRRAKFYKLTRAGKRQLEIKKPIGRGEHRPLPGFLTRRAKRCRSGDSLPMVCAA